MIIAHRKRTVIIRRDHQQSAASGKMSGIKGGLAIRRTGWTGFLRFAASQQPNRIGWLALALTLQGCVLAPLTLLAIMINGNSIVLWLLCTLSFAGTEVVNLAAMPTRVTIPVLLGGIVLDLVIIAASFVLF